MLLLELLSLFWLSIKSIGSNVSSKKNSGIGSCGGGSSSCSSRSCALPLVNVAKNLKALKNFRYVQKDLTTPNNVASICLRVWKVEVAIEVTVVVVVVVVT